MQKERQKISSQKESSSFFKRIIKTVSKKTKSGNQSNSLKVIEETLTVKVNLLSELKQITNEIEGALSNEASTEQHEILELPRLTGNLKKRVKCEIICAVFQAKHELLGLNLNKEPTFISVFQINQTSLDKWQPWRRIALDLTEEFQVHFLNSFNSSSHLCLQWKNKTLKTGASNGLK